MAALLSTIFYLISSLFPPPCRQLDSYLDAYHGLAFFLTLVLLQAASEMNSQSLVIFLISY